MDFVGFDWDLGNRAKCQSHGVSIAEIESLFRGIVSIAPDVAHSLSEERFKAVGKSAVGRDILVAFTIRIRGESTLIRPVSARYMHRKEVASFEKDTAGSDDR